MAEITSSVRTLVRLKGKLTLRQFTREPGRILGAIIVLIVFGPMVIAATIGSAIGYARLPDHWPTALLGGILVALWGIWLIFPILFSSINEGLDVTRLLIYPLTQRQLAVSTLLGTLFDYPTYLVIPLLGAMLWGFGRSAALPVVLLALLLSYAHMVIIGQLVVTAIGGILQSRRFRDVSIMVASLMGSSCYFINLGVQRFSENLSSSIDEEAFLLLQPLNVLQWFPTGAGARAIEQALNGAWGAALLWLLYTAVLLAVLAWVWLRLLTRLATGGGFLINPKPREKMEPEQKRPSRSRQIPLLSALPADIAAL
ncbi:MAG: hypothetical protein KC421_04280, partial [Anaerolineales bacterium]|nr:hypothetical protein [Anaerolineales bacterium]